MFHPGVNALGKKYRTRWLVDHTSDAERPSPSGKSGAAVLLESAMRAVYPHPSIETMGLGLNGFRTGERCPPGPYEGLPMRLPKANRSATIHGHGARCVHGPEGFWLKQRSGGCVPPAEKISGSTWSTGRAASPRATPNGIQGTSAPSPVGTFIWRQQITATRGLRRSALPRPDPTRTCARSTFCGDSAQPGSLVCALY